MSNLLYLENNSSLLGLRRLIDGMNTPSSNQTIVCSGFLPEEMTTPAPETILYHDDVSSPVSRSADQAHQQRDAEMQAVVDQFQTAYPDIIFEVNLENDQVNAVSWIDDKGQKHVQIYGGLFHSAYMKPEGLSLVLSHEVGHLTGGAPYHEGRTRIHPYGVPKDLLSSEGQADYYGASVVMRNMSNQFGFDYDSTMQAGIDQLNNLFHYGIQGSTSQCTYPPDGSGPCQCAKYFGCDYPPIDHRMETYVAAENGQAKPVCAGPTQDLTHGSNLTLDQLLNSARLVEIMG